MKRTLAAIVGVGLTPASLAAPLKPDRPGQRAPDRNFDVEHLHLDIDLMPSEGRVAGTASLTVRRLWPGALRLDQVALEIESVTRDGAELSWWTEADHLVVDLDDADQGGVIDVRYAASPRTGLHFRRPGPDSVDEYGEVWSQGEGEDNRYWFPGWDHPNDRFTYSSDIRAPEGWTVLTNADGIDLVNYLVMVAAAPYEVHVHADSPDVSVLVPPKTPESAVAPVLEPVPAMMSHMADRTGVEWPWGPYRQVFVQRFLYGGMENTGATVMNAEYLLPHPSNGVTSAERVESIVAHELAHQWYGDWLTCRDWRELWLNEGFATFVAADWMAEAHGEASWYNSVRRWYASSQSGSALGRRFHQGDIADSNNVYMKGASVLQMLRVMLGEEAFWRGIRRYTATSAPSLVDTHDLRSALEAETGRELGWFFQQWVELSHVPEVSVSHSYTGTMLNVKVRQVVSDDRPAYVLPVEVQVGLKDGTVQTREGWLEGGSLDLQLELDSPPRFVAFDPHGGLLLKLKEKQDPEAWAAQALHGPTVWARLRAIDELGDTADAQTLVGIASNGDEALELRRLAIEGLGKQRSSSSLVDLNATLTDPRLRAAVASALGRCHGDAASTALAEVTRRDLTPAVRASALQALVAVDPARARGLALKALGKTRGGTVVVWEAAVRVLGRTGDLGDVSTLLRHPGPRRINAATASAAARIVVREEKLGTSDVRQPRERVARFSEKLLMDDDQRTRETAVGVLGEVGDARSISMLVALQNREPMEGLRKKASGSIKAIRGRDGTRTVGANELEARLKAVEERMDDIDKRLDERANRH